ncbi:MAG: T9SS type A sorting domain-containing protein [Chitinophagales bacterium]
MKKILPCLFLLAGYFTSYTQPQLLSDEMMAVGGEWHLHEIANIYEIDTTIQGADVTWDFTAFLDGGSDFNIEIVDPTSTAHGDDFPDANYCYKETPGNSYRYFKRDADKMMRVGSYTTANGVNTFTDPQTEFVFPLELGAENLDTWDNTLSGFGGGIYNIWCIGYGTLILPDLTFTDVLMVRVRISEGDLYEVPVYFWYSSDNGAILCEYIDGDGFWIGTGGYYIYELEEAPVAINDDWVMDLKYNNPVSDIFHLSFATEISSTINYSIINALGEEVYTEVAQHEQFHDLKINFNNFAAGLYTVIISSGALNEQVQRVKILKL